MQKDKFNVVIHEARFLKKLSHAVLKCGDGNYELKLEYSYGNI